MKDFLLGILSVIFWVFVLAANIVCLVIGIKNVIVVQIVFISISILFQIVLAAVIITVCMGDD